MMLRLHFCGELFEIVSRQPRSLHRVNGKRQFLQEDGGYVNLPSRTRRSVMMLADTAAYLLLHSYFRSDKSQCKKKKKKSGR